jgi:signal transduction histidine kinase
MVDSLQFEITYSILLVSSMLIAFFKPRQERDKLERIKAAHLDIKVQDQREMLEKALKLKYEFLANIEHEGHTPISTIVAMSELLFSNYDELSKAQLHDGLKMVSESSNRLLKLVNNLIDVSRLSSMTYQLNKTEVDLSELVYSRLEYCMKLYCGDKDLRFVTEIENVIKIHCDEYYITSTLDNLISNAIKYSHGGIVLISLKRLGSDIEFSISDEGVGIPREELISIFDPFTVGSRTRTKSGAIPNGQVGLGLALCKLVIKAHNGTISAESAENNGAIFKFILPLT